jgi:polysaccharide pyruvyl transferase WcaK-like protein
MIHKPIFYYSVLSDNVGDRAIRESIINNIQSIIDIPITFLDAKKDELTKDRIIKQLNQEASILIIAGGGLYSNCDTSSGWYFPCKSELIKEIKVPIVLLGIGCNNHLQYDIFGELSNKAKKNITLINNVATISSVRDKRTYDTLKDLGIETHSIILDPACFLSINQKIKKEKRVTINIAQHAPSLGRFDGDNEIRNKNIDYFTTICEYLKSKKYKVVFIALDPLEQSLIIDLQKRFPDLEYLNTSNINKILEEYAKCEFSIGMKMHSNILSFATNTPFISVYYDEKSVEFLKLIKWENFGISVFDNYQDQVINLIDNISSTPQFYCDKFKTLKENCNKKYLNEIKKIHKIITNTELNRPANSYLEKPKITVLLPTYNRPTFTKEAIESIIQQTYTNWELLIYDDGSTDDTVEIIKSYIELDNRIKLIEGKTNKGGLYAKQMLLDACQTQVACWQDSDDLSHPKRLEKQLELMCEHSLVFCSWSYWDYLNKKWIKTQTPNSKRFHALSSLMFEITKDLELDKTKIWGSLVWFEAMKVHYPNWTTTKEELYFIRRHPGRITEEKRKIERLIERGMFVEEDIIHLTYEELKKFLQKYP